MKLIIHVLFIQKTHEKNKNDLTFQHTTPISSRRKVHKKKDMIMNIFRETFESPCSFIFATHRDALTLLSIH